MFAFSFFAIVTNAEMYMIVCDFSLNIQQTADSNQIASQSREEGLMRLAPIITISCSLLSRSNSFIICFSKLRGVNCRLCAILFANQFEYSLEIQV